MKNDHNIESLTAEVKSLRLTVEELKQQVRKLEREKKIPGVFVIGDKVIVLSSGLVGNRGDKARVTKVGKRISILIDNKHTNRSPHNLEHDN